MPTKIVINNSNIPIVPKNDIKTSDDSGLRFSLSLATHLGTPSHELELLLHLATPPPYRFINTVNNWNFNYWNMSYPHSSYVTRHMYREPTDTMNDLDSANDLSL